MGNPVGGGVGGGEHRIGVRRSPTTKTMSPTHSPMGSKQHNVNVNVPPTHPSSSSSCRRPKVLCGLPLTASSDMSTTVPFSSSADEMGARSQEDAEKRMSWMSDVHSPQFFLIEEEDDISATSGFLSNPTINAENATTMTITRTNTDVQSITNSIGLQSMRGMGMEMGMEREKLLPLPRLGGWTQRSGGASASSFCHSSQYDSKNGMTPHTIGSSPTSYSSSSGRNGSLIMEVPLAQALQQLTVIKSKDAFPDSDMHFDNPDTPSTFFDSPNSNPEIFQLPDEFGFTSKTFLKEHKKNLVSVHDKYYFEDVLGEGAYGVVWGAHERMHPETPFESRGRSVAIKKLRKQAFRCGKVCGGNVAREMAVLKTVDHPTAARLFEVFEDEYSIYLVLEKCEGGELMDRITARDLYTEEEAKDIIRQIASALAYCHARGIVHRDIKPENILFASADRRVVKLVDFGLAVRETAGTQVPCNLKGTLHYSAPELFTPGNKVTPKMDTWSLGCVLYGMISGNAPFPVDTNGKRSEHMVPMEGEAWAHISIELKMFIESLLCIDPEVRLSAEELLRSPWLAESQTTFINNFSPEKMKTLKTHMEQLRSFQSKSLFRRICSSILARHMEWSQSSVFYESFRRMDSLNDGTITFDEWANIWSLLCEDAESGECEKVFAAVNLSNSGSIEFTEFLAACVDHSVVEESALWSTFAYFGPKDGHVKFSALKAGVKEALVGGDTCDVVVMMDEELSCMRDVCIGFHDFKCMLRQENSCYMEYCSVHHQYANERLSEENDSMAKSPESKQSSKEFLSSRHSKSSGCSSTGIQRLSAQYIQKSPTPSRQKKSWSGKESSVENHNSVSSRPPLMLPLLTRCSWDPTIQRSVSFSPHKTRTSPCSSRNATCNMARSMASIRRICTSPKFHLDVSSECTPIVRPNSNSNLRATTWL